jgi:glycosyltransferase involved in cell wall biosynthesis
MTKSANASLRILVDAREAVRNPSGIGVVARQFVGAASRGEWPGITWHVLRPSRRRLFGGKLGRLLEFLIWKTVWVYVNALRHRCHYILSLDCIGCPLSRRNIVFVHDFIFYAHPEWTNEWGRLWRALVPLSLRRARLVFCNSLNTRDDLYRFFPSARSRLRVVTVPLGFDAEVYRPGSSEDVSVKTYSWPPAEAFALFVGNHEPRRNLAGAIGGLAVARKLTGLDLKLYIVGHNKGNRAQIETLAREAGVVSGVRILGRVNDRELAALYRKAQVYVYPSFYEGFGLTLLEAMACGCPVVTSTRTSLAEVAGEAGMLVDPDSREEIGCAIARVLAEPELRRQLVRRGHANVRRYGWQAMANAMYDAIRGLTQ